jgi:hypothetical protein
MRGSCRRDRSGRGAPRASRAWRMEPTRARPAERRTGSEEALIRDRLVNLVRKQPLVAVGAAAGVGAILGGIFLSRLGRLVAVAAAGYVANELWHREGRLAIDEVVERLSPR